MIASRALLLTCALAAAATAPAGCDSRLPVLILADAEPTWLNVPDGGVEKQELPAVCAPRSQVFLEWSDPRGNLRLSLPPGTSVKALAIPQAAPAESAVGLAREGVVGLVATAAAAAGGTDLFSQLADLRERLADALQGRGGKLASPGGGVEGRTYDGHRVIQKVIWDVSVPGGWSPTQARDLLLSAFLVRALEGPRPAGPDGMAAATLRIKLSLAARPAQVLLSAGVAPLAGVSPAESIDVLLDDLGNGTAVGRPGAAVELTCDRAPLGPVPVADIIWVVDESGSMDDNRADIVRNAESLFRRVRALGIDFRMGVTGVKNPRYGATLGKFCSRASPDRADDGGEDRFLLPAEQALFSACVFNPPYYEPYEEYGLSNAYWALKRHLPRARGAADKIREGAQVALIFVTDEVPQEIMKGSSFEGQPGTLQYSGDFPTSSSCKLAPGILDPQLDPFEELLESVSLPKARVTVHLIGGICGNRCGADVAHGYQDLARAFGGQVGDVCQPNLETTLNEIVDTIAGAASPRPLAQVPISSTLLVQAGGVVLPRSPTRGFSYDAAANALVFNRVRVGFGAEVIAAYYRFTAGGAAAGPPGGVEFGRPER